LDAGKSFSAMEETIDTTVLTIIEYEGEEEKLNDTLIFWWALVAICVHQVFSSVFTYIYPPDHVKASVADDETTWYYWQYVILQFTFLRVFWET